MRTLSRRLTGAQLLAAARLSGAAHRLRENEDGQASAEYAGVIFVAVTIVVALIGASAQWGTQLTDLVNEQIDRLGAAG